MNTFFTKKRSIDQIIFWLFIYCFVFDYHLMEGNWGEAFLMTFIETLSYAFISYINYSLLIPNFLQKKRYLFYGIGILILLMVYINGVRLSGLETYLYEGSNWRNNFSMTINVILFVLLSTLYSYYQQWQVARERQLQLRSEKLAAELKFLKTQISPHFIFNTLNNIYSLAIQKHDNTAPMVSQLSSIMRYIIYDGAQEQIALDKDIKNLNHYIQLQLLRKPISQNVDFYTEGDFTKKSIAPLLLLNFVENCFKHSDIDENSTAWIKINICLDQDKLDFEAQNTYQTKPNTAIGGIGIENTKRQLQLRYPNQYQLDITQKEGIYSLRLQLNL